LVAALSFDASVGGTLAWTSGNANTVTINGATWMTAGKYNGARSFNGSSSYVGLCNPADLDLTSRMTWSTWIYATGIPADAGQIIARSDSRGRQLKRSLDASPHTSGNGNRDAPCCSAMVSTLNTWYHVADVHDALPAPSISTSTAPFFCGSSRTGSQ
jgi:hypothetical protein